MEIFKNEHKLSRSEFLKSSGKSILGFTGLLSGLSAISTSVYSEPVKNEHHHDHHHDEYHQYDDLIRASSHCATQGTICIEHCVDLYRKKDMTMAECMNAANEMVVVCRTMSSLAAMNSKHIKEYAKVCIEYCKTCAKECKVHAKEHKPCKDCMESCQECIKACEKLIA